MTSETQFAPLPVRQRGTIEIIDTALKLYRRYFGVLMAWSALVALAGLVGTVVPFASLLAYPLIYGAGACSIAAAVRGQRISFGQVWDFTKPRYGALIGIIFLSALILFAGTLAVFILMMIIGFGAAWLLETANAPAIISTVLGAIALVLVLVGGSVASVLVYAWLSMVPVIACLEDDKRGSAALGRAWNLIKGSWLRVLGLSTLLTIAIVAVMGIVGGSMALFGQGFGALLDPSNESAIFQWALTFSAFLTLFFLFWNPIQTLIIAVLYLDLRVRKEALDLEWTSYATAPPPSLEAQNPNGAPAPTHLPTDADRARLSAAVPDSTSAFAGATPPPPRPPAPNSAPAPATMPPRPPAPTVLESAPATMPPPRPPAPAPTAAENTPAMPPPRPPAPVAVNLDKLAVPASAPTPFAPAIEESPSSFGAGAEERDARV